MTQSRLHDGSHSRSSKPGKSLTVEYQGRNRDREKGARRSGVGNSGVPLNTDWTTFKRSSTRPDDDERGQMQAIRAEAVENGAPTRGRRLFYRNRKPMVRVFRPIGLLPVSLPLLLQS